MSILGFSLRWPQTLSADAQSTAIMSTSKDAFMAFAAARVLAFLVLGKLSVSDLRARCSPVLLLLPLLLPLERSNYL